MQQRAFPTLSDVLMLLVLILGAVNWWLKPEAWAPFAAAMLFVPVMWWARRAARRKTGPEAAEGRKQIERGIVQGAGLLALGLAVTIALALELIAGSLGDRTIQAGIGLILVATGNAIPKTLEPLSDRVPGGRVQALQRFTGWALVVAGLVWSLSWLFLPVDTATVVSMAFVATTSIIVLARLAWLRMTCRASEPAGGAS